MKATLKLQKETKYSYRFTLTLPVRDYHQVFTIEKPRRPISEKELVEYTKKIGKIALQKYNVDEIVVL